MFLKRSVQSIVFVFFILNIQLFGQNFDPINIEFEVDGNVLQNPLIGGLIAPQFTSFDLDGQGPEDLIVFERSGKVLLPFINNSTPGNPDYTYAPEYTSSFPDARAFLQFHDFNNDGKKDMFTGAFGVAGIEVYMNTSTDNNISLEIVEMNDASGFGNALVFPAGGAFTQIYVSNIDIPAIVDIDKDGDLDILSFEPDGGYMYYYQNMVKEMNLPADTLAYRLVDFCWGKFFESGLGEQIFLSDNVNQCASGLLPNEILVDERHAGSTVLAFDADNDDDFDLLLGDLTNNGLVYLENGSIGDQALIIEKDSIYPSNDVETDIFIFVAPFFIDIDNDGKRDLIAAVNNALGSQNKNHIWYYKNVGEDETPIFELVQKNFLHETTLIMGQGAAPTFLDYNGDGLQDLLVGNNRLILDVTKSETSLFLYENVGTINEAKYKLVNSDYLELKSVTTDLIGFLSPTIGDLDGDGDDDLVVGASTGRLFYFENEAGEGNPYNFKPFVYDYFDIRAGNSSSPTIFDFDGDGLNDLLLGEKNTTTDIISGEVTGSLNFHKNYGSIGDPIFYSKIDTLENTDSSGDVGLIRNTTPRVFTTDEGAKMSIGSKFGELHIFDDLVGNIDGQFNEVYENLPILHTGDLNTAAFADIDNDGYHEVIVGNNSGGLRAFNTIFKTAGGPSSTTEIKSNIKLYPNPTTNILNVQFANASDTPYTIYNMDGKLVQSGNLNGTTTAIQTDQLSTGVYNISVNNRASRFIKI